ncbi:hypothetical protein Emed_007317 [Eimeria media]
MVDSETGVEGPEEEGPSALEWGGGGRGPEVDEPDWKREGAPRCLASQRKGDRPPGHLAAKSTGPANRGGPVKAEGCGSLGKGEIAAPGKAPEGAEGLCTVSSQRQQNVEATKIREAVEALRWEVLWLPGQLQALHSLLVRREASRQASEGSLVLST